MNGLWALVPLVLYIVLCFCPFGQIFAVIAGIIVAAVMGGHGLMDVAAGIRAGMGSFLGYIGLIILLGGGSTFVLGLMLVTAALTGLAGRLKVKEIIDAVCDGARPLVWLFFFFVLLDPFINFISDAGAFQALAGVLAPYVEKSGHVAFVAFTTLVGIFGVPGAAVAQAEVLNKMFLELAQAQGIPMVLWAAVLLVGSQMTSFAMPEGDMQGQMGLARSDDLKSVLCNGWLICLFTTLYVVVRAFVI